MKKVFVSYIEYNGDNPRNGVYVCNNDLNTTSDFRMLEREIANINRITSVTILNFHIINNFVDCGNCIKMETYKA